MYSAQTSHSHKVVLYNVHILRHACLPSSIRDCSHSVKKEYPLSIFAITSWSLVDTFLWLRSPCSKIKLHAVKYLKVHLIDGVSVGAGL